MNSGALKGWPRSRSSPSRGAGRPWTPDLRFAASGVTMEGKTADQRPSVVPVLDTGTQSDVYRLLQACASVIDCTHLSQWCKSGCAHTSRGLPG